MHTIVKSTVLLLLVLIALLGVWTVDYSEEQVSFKNDGNHTFRLSAFSLDS